MEFQVACLGGELIGEVDNEGLVLLIRINVFNGAGVWDKEFLVLLEGEAAGEFGERVNEAGGGQSSGSRGRECAENESSPIGLGLWRGSAAC